MLHFVGVFFMNCRLIFPIFWDVSCTYKNRQCDRMLHSVDWYLPTFQYIFRVKQCKGLIYTAAEARYHSGHKLGCCSVYFCRRCLIWAHLASFASFFLSRKVVPPNCWKKIIRNIRPGVSVQCTKPFHSPDVPILFPGLLFVRGRRPGSEHVEASFR
jgi:hypothetical protein